MNTKISPAVVGFFVVGAIALAVIGLIAFGSFTFFAKTERFIVYFTESVHGLDLGSPVTLGGVRVGRVVDLSIRFDRATNRSVAAVVCEFSDDRIADRSGAMIDLGQRDTLQGLVDHGLRAQLGVSSFATGLLFVELEFLDPHEYPDLSNVTDTKYVDVPSIPSAISEFQNSASKVLANLEQVDFKGLSIELTKLIVTARQRLDGVDLKGVIAQWKRTGESVDAAAKSADLTRTLANFNATLDALRVSLGKVNTQVDAGGQGLQQTLAQARDALASFNAAAATARKFIDSQQNLGADADRAFDRVADAAEAVQRLADFLERNPNAVISGRKAPE